MDSRYDAESLLPDIVANELGPKLPLAKINALMRSSKRLHLLFGVNNQALWENLLVTDLGILRSTLKEFAKDLNDNFNGMLPDWYTIYRNLFTLKQRYTADYNQAYFEEIIMYDANHTAVLAYCMNNGAVASGFIPAEERKFFRKIIFYLDSVSLVTHLTDPVAVNNALLREAHSARAFNISRFFITRDHQYSIELNDDNVREIVSNGNALNVKALIEAKGLESLLTVRMSAWLWDTLAYNKYIDLVWLFELMSQAYQQFKDQFSLSFTFIETLMYRVESDASLKPIVFEILKWIIDNDIKLEGSKLADARLGDIDKLGFCDALRYFVDNEMLTLPSKLAYLIEGRVRPSCEVDSGGSPPPVPIVAKFLIYLEANTKLVLMTEAELMQAVSTNDLLPSVAIVKQVIKSGSMGCFQFLLEERFALDISTESVFRFAVKECKYAMAEYLLAPRFNQRPTQMDVAYLIGHGQYAFVKKVMRDYCIEFSNQFFSFLICVLHLHDHDLAICGPVHPISPRRLSFALTLLNGINIHPDDNQTHGFLASFYLNPSVCYLLLDPHYQVGNIDRDMQSHFIVEKDDSIQRMVAAHAVALRALEHHHLDADEQTLMKQWQECITMSPRISMRVALHAAANPGLYELPECQVPIMLTMITAALDFKSLSIIEQNSIKKYYKEANIEFNLNHESLKKSLL